MSISLTFVMVTTLFGATAWTSLNLDDVNGFEIDTAIYVRSLLMRLRLTEVPSFEGYRFRGEGKLRTIPDGLRVLSTILREVVRNFRSPRANSIKDFEATPRKVSHYWILMNRKRTYFVNRGRTLGKPSGHVCHHLYLYRRSLG